MMTGRRPLDGISTLQSAYAYHKISDMLVWLQYTVYLPKIVDLMKQVETSSETEQHLRYSSNWFLVGRRLNI